MKIRLGGIEFEVGVVERLQAGGDPGNRESLWGHITYETPKIELDTRLSPITAYTVLWHEIIHGILTQAGHEAANANEPIVDAIGYGIANALIQNEVLRDPDMCMLALEKLKND